MRANEFIVEYRDRLLQYVKSLLPTWPEYVLKDWLVPNKGNFSNLPADAVKNGIMEKVQGAGLTPNSKWQLIPNMKFTMDMFDPKTKQLLIGRAGGSSDLGMGIPRDKERHATQATLAQQQGGVRKEPVLLIKSANGYELLEGWHRTIQHFHKFPDGYTGPAYVAVAQGQQGVAEDSINNTPTIGINVRSDGDIDYASLIVDGKKKYESRKTDSLRPYVGKTVGIVRTGNGPAVAIGQVTIGEPIIVDVEKFNKLRNQHLVPQGSKFDIDSDGTKYLYPMINSVRWDNEKPIKSKGIVSRKIQEQGVTEGTLSVDVPNEDWLQEKIDYAKSKGRNSYGVPYMGSTTASVRGTPPRVRVMRLASLPGMRNEQTNIRKNDLKWLMDYMEKTGKLPPMSSSPDHEYLPYIAVAYNGEAWVNEGNHRIMAAYRLNWQDMPIEIRYFDGGERIKDGPMYPGKIGLS
jgi:predicted transcriptional regulator